MRRKRTRVTVWPAITDLMTAILIIAFLSGTVTVAYINNNSADDGLDNPEIDEMLRDSISELQTQVDSLLDVFDEYLNEYPSAQLVIVLKDSIENLLDDEGKIGSRSCLGRDEDKQPNSPMTIRVNPADYQIRLNTQLIESGWHGLQQYVRPYDQRELSESEMIDFAREMYRLGDGRIEGKCRFFVRLEKSEEVSQEALVLRWNNLKDYFAGLTNPSVL